MNGDCSNPRSHFIDSSLCHDANHCRVLLIFVRYRNVGQWRTFPQVVAQVRPSFGQGGRTERALILLYTYRVKIRVFYPRYPVAPVSIAFAFISPFKILPAIFCQDLQVVKTAPWPRAGHFASLLILDCRSKWLAMNGTNLNTSN